MFLTSVLVDRVAMSVALRIELRVVNSWQPLNERTSNHTSVAC